ncbi:hypothetical protein K3718_10845 [Leisingera aquaemixtae]|uniref:Phage-related protein, tail component n=1 Tax=Leisingera aquaemixtae TaxID=1396826 RepID=A0ABY5WF54_9RHOB|nr:hypothetical protein [Leisingera aquaemixtae]UWQ40070.1 hypothetical protein K3718_10845 [Leisingera aquaemixtae]
MRKIHLHGALSQFGEMHELDVLTAGEAVTALCANFPGFMDELRRGSWVLLRGDTDTGFCLDEEAITGMRLGNADLHIMPEVEGAKNGNGAVKAIIGVALIAATGGSAAFLTQPILAGAASGVTWGNAIGQLGLAMSLAGVSQLLAPETETQPGDGEKSFTMTGPVSQHGEGNPIQIVYGGPIIVGGMLISGGIDADGLESLIEQPVETPDPAQVETNPDNHGGGGAGDR